MLKIISIRLTELYEKQISLSNIDRLKMILGFQNILHQAGLFFVIFLTACLLHIFLETLLFFIIFAIYRGFAGGFHLTTSLGCICATTLINIGSTLLALSIHLNCYTTAILVGTVLVITLIFAPRRTKNYPLTNKQRQNLKRLSALIVIFSGLISLFCPCPVRELIAMAILAEGLMLIPKPDHSNQNQA